MNIMLGLLCIYLIYNVWIVIASYLAYIIAYVAVTCENSYNLTRSCSDNQKCSSLLTCYENNSYNCAMAGTVYLVFCGFIVFIVGGIICTIVDVIMRIHNEFVEEETDRDV